MSRLVVQLEVGNGEEVTFEYTGLRVNAQTSPVMTAAKLFGQAIEDVEAYLGRRGVDLEPPTATLP